MTDTSDTFDWANDDSVAVHAQPALAVYANKFCQVVIRREAEWNEEEDVFLHISRENVLTIIAHMLRAAGMFDIEIVRATGGGGYVDVELEDLIVAGAVVDRADHKPKDPTAAERQRRCRENKKRRERDNRDGERDSDRDTQEPLRLTGTD